MDKRSRVLLGMVLVAIASLLTIIFLFSTASRIPPLDKTRSLMVSFRYRLADWRAEHGSLPSSLSELPHRPGYNNSLNDGWRRPILYSVESGEVSLKSYGQDGLPGGVGLDTDLVLQFPVEDNLDTIIDIKRVGADN